MPGTYAVEWGRQAYSSKWRVYNDNPDLLVAGRYVRCPPGTPFLPYGHLYGSRFWTSNERTPGALGEYDGPWQWDTGLADIDWPPAKFTGNPLDFPRGETFDPGRCPERTFLEGIPEECWQYERIAVFVRDFPLVVNTPVTLKNFALLLKLVYQDPDLAKTYAAALMGPGAVSTYWPDGFNFLPAMLVCTSARGTLVSCTGWHDPWERAFEAAKLSQAPERLGPFATLRQWRLNAADVLERIETSAGLAVRPITLTGHSKGGALAMIVAYFLTNVGLRSDIRVATFGAPKPGGSSLVNPLRDVAQVHIVNSGDPVPDMPPSALLFGLIQAAIPGPTLRNWDDWTKNINRKILYSDGTLVDDPDIAGNLRIMVEMAVELSLGNTPAIEHAHDMAEYSARMALVP